MENQILDTLNQYIAENPGSQLNEKALAQLHASAKSYDRLVNDMHYVMKTEINEERTCIVQFLTDQDKVISTYTFFNTVITEAPKKK